MHSACGSRRAPQCSGRPTLQAQHAQHRDPYCAPSTPYIPRCAPVSPAELRARHGYQGARGGSNVVPVDARQGQLPLGKRNKGEAGGAKRKSPYAAGGSNLALSRVAHACCCKTGSKLCCFCAGDGALMQGCFPLQPPSPKQHPAQRREQEEQGGDGPVDGRVVGGRRRAAVNHEWRQLGVALCCLHLHFFICQGDLTLRTTAARAARGSRAQRWRRGVPVWGPCAQGGRHVEGPGPAERDKSGWSGMSVAQAWCACAWCAADALPAALLSVIHCTCSGLCCQVASALACCADHSQSGMSEKEGRLLS